MALRDAIQHLQAQEQRAALKYEMSFGMVSGGSKAWQITHSTLPGRSGQYLLGDDVTIQQLQDMVGSGAKLVAGAYCSEAGWDIIDASSSACKTV